MKVCPRFSRAAVSYLQIRLTILMKHLLTISLVFALAALVVPVHANLSALQSASAPKIRPAAVAARPGLNHFAIADLGRTPNISDSAFIGKSAAEIFAERKAIVDNFKPQRFAAVFTVTNVND